MAVGKDTFRFKVGDFECLVVKDGVVTMPEKPFNAFPGQYHDIQPGLVLDLLCLVIRVGEHTILLDTGLGAAEYPVTGNLPHILKNEGIPPQQIDTVILSHGHGDHISGITDAEDRLVFPNARYVMSRAEWEFWMADPELIHHNLDEKARQMFSTAVKKNLIQIKDRFDIIEGESGSVAGIDLMITPGHTPGHMMLVISSGKEQLYCLGDLFHEPSDLLQPDLYDIFAIDPEQSHRTTIQVLSRLGASNPLVFNCHFPFPGLGHIVKKGDGWLWQPIEMKS
jgi:glyoxylase-like metal-dependent hydrolase (beta-lactamase superfamily II)